MHVRMNEVMLKPFCSSSAQTTLAQTLCACVACVSEHVYACAFKPSLLGWRCAGSSYAQTTLVFVQVGQPSIWLQTWTCAHTPATNVDYRRMQCGSSNVDDRRKHLQSHIDFFTCYQVADTGGGSTVNATRPLHQMHGARMDAAGTTCVPPASSEYLPREIAV